jgi:hypothetical protein
MFQSLYIVRMTVANRDNGMTSVEVKVLGAVGVVGVAPAAFNYFYIK